MNSSYTTYRQVHHQVDDGFIRGSIFQINMTLRTSSHGHVDKILVRHMKKNDQQLVGPFLQDLPCRAPLPLALGGATRLRSKST